MNIGMITTAGVRCGICSYSLYLCQALQKLGVDTTILGEHPLNEFHISKEYEGIIPIDYCWKRNEPFTELIEKGNGFPIEKNLTHLLKESKFPKIVTMHDIVPRGSQIDSYMNTIFQNADSIIVHTKTCMDLARQYDVDKSKLSLIPHGTLIVDIPDKISTRKELNIDENLEIVLSWGFIWESKGILDLVKIFAEILKTHPKAMFIHAGGVHPIIQGSEYLTRILKEAVKLGITPQNFQITGWVPEDKVPQWFSVADVIVLNYMRGSASASGAAHRALASYRPIVKTDDLCLEEIPGFTVPRFSPTDLYQGIKKVLEDKDLQKSLVEQQNKAAIEMSWEAIAKKHKILYESL